MIYGASMVLYVWVFFVFSDQNGERITVLLVIQNFKKSKVKIKDSMVQKKTADLPNLAAL